MSSGKIGFMMPGIFVASLRLMPNENIELELAERNLEAGGERRLRRRAELIRWLLTPQPIA